MEVKNSLIGGSTKTHSGFIGDSIIGENARIGAIFGSANVRLDRTNVKSVVKGEKVDTGNRSLGVIIGENTVVGERATTMPGVIIGNNVRIGPSTTVMQNVDSDVTFYTEFAGFVEKSKTEKSMPSGSSRKIRKVKKKLSNREN
jgi:bifunctional UDP-N-acetylglucosamine pyrophosphorylase/glucosamine-1-phosphate N-acetyltransferase